MWPDQSLILGASEASIDTARIESLCADDIIYPYHCVLAELLHEINSILHMQILRFQGLSY